MATQVTEVQLLDISKLHKSSTNPRTHFDKKFLEELTESVRNNGIITPLIVRSNESGFEIVAGEQRYRAAQAAKLKVVPCLVRELTDIEAQEIQILENLARRDVHPLEEAAGYEAMRKTFLLNLDQLATKFNKKPQYIQQRLKYVDLIDPIKKLFLEGEISIGHADQVARLQPEQQKECLPMLKRGYNVKELREEIERHFFLLLTNSPFDTKDAKLVPAAGSCTDCPKRTGFNKLLFADIQQADVCTDRSCFEGKIAAFIKVQTKAHPDALQLVICASYERDRVGTAKLVASWVKAGDKNCPETKEGIVVSQVSDFPPSDQAAPLGSLLRVCVNPKCKTHRAPEPERGGGSNEWSRKQAKQMKARKIELRRRALLFKELATKVFGVNSAMTRHLLDWQIQTLSHDNAKALCEAMGWEPGKASYGGKDYQGGVRKNLANLEAREFERWTYLLMLTESDLWFHSGSEKKPKLLELAAERNGISLAAIAKLSKEKPKKITTKLAKAKKGEKPVAKSKPKSKTKSKPKPKPKKAPAEVEVETAAPTDGLE